MQQYFANFVKTGDPNGSGLPQWPAVSPQEVPVMHIDVTSATRPERHRERYLFLERTAAKH
jgi:para-nitrobenzyl esterase